MIPERVFEGDLTEKREIKRKKTANSDEESLFMFYYDYCNNNALYRIETSYKRGAMWGIERG